MLTPHPNLNPNPPRTIRLWPVPQVGKHTDMEKRISAGALSAGGAHIHFVVTDSTEIQERYFRDEGRVHPETGEALVSELPQSIMLSPWVNSNLIIPNQIVYNPVMMNHFLQDFAWPLVVVHHYKNSSMLFKKRPGFTNHIIFFTDAPKDSDMWSSQVEALATVAEQYRGKAIFIICDPEDNPFSESSAKQLKVTEPMPAMRIVGSAARSARRIHKFRFAPFGSFGEQNAAETLKNTDTLAQTIGEWVKKFFDRDLDDMASMKEKARLKSEL